MDSRIVSLARNEHVRVLAATGFVLAVLVAVTDATLAVIAPVAVIFASLTVHNAMDDVYGLAHGSNWLSYGASLLLAGVVFAFVGEPDWIALLLVVPGLWFILDGATTMRYEPEREQHEFLTTVDEDDSSEIMFRMQTLNRVYQHLRDAREPKTVTALAEEVGLKESRVADALGYLAEQDQVERSGDRYEAVPPRFGKVTPIIDFFRWIPRRLVRPFRLFAAG